MDKKTLVANLNRIFCDDSKKDKRYAKVWLEHADFGGLYFSKKYILHAQAAHHIENCNEEIKDVLSLLDSHAKEELRDIWRVSFYHNDEYTYCESGLVIFEEEKACP